MNNLLSISDFTGRFDIPNKTGLGVSDSVDALVEQYQEEFLIELFGVSLYKDLESGLSQIVVADKWSKLLDGEDVDYGSLVRRYRGATESLKAYIYFRWMQNAAKALQGLGLVAPKAENGGIVSPEWKMTDVWNYMLELRQSMEYESNYMSVREYVDYINDKTPDTYQHFNLTWYFGLNPLVTW